MCFSFRDNRQYAKRDCMKLDKDGGYYSRHVSAMTAEGLHEKSDIAAELAVRDALLDQAQDKQNKMEKEIEIIRDGLGEISECIVPVNKDKLDWLIQTAIDTLAAVNC